MPRFISTKQLTALKQKFFVQKKVCFHDMNILKLTRLILMLIFVFGVGYVYQVNSLATMGYETKDLEERKQQLTLQNQRLELRVTEAKSTARILERLEGMDMVPVYQVSYVKPQSGVAVVK